MKKGVPFAFILIIGCIMLFSLVIDRNDTVFSANKGDSAYTGSVSVEARGMAKKVTLNKTKLSIAKGERYTLKLKNAVAKNVKWKTSDKKVAVVSKKGRVTAKKKGKATITAIYQKVKYKCQVTVTKKKAEKQQRMTLKIDGATVTVDWENNESVQALSALVNEEPLTIAMSKYGGFEQVGKIGSSLPQQDTEMTTHPGDIVLYEGNQIVIFYGSNSWSYTRLGKVRGLSDEELEDLLGQKNVTLTISAEKT